VVQSTGVPSGAGGEGAASYVDVRDAAAVAAHVLCTDGHAADRYVITGPEALTGADVAGRLSDVLGRPVSYQSLPAEQYEAALRSAGMPEWHAGALVELQAVIGRDEFATVTDEVTKAIGRPARTAAAFFADHQATFA
jgi:uncharacterized protein YbjT (DUF2867 family)